MSTSPAPTGVRRSRSAAALAALGLAATAAVVVPSIAEPDSSDPGGVRAADPATRTVLEQLPVPEVPSSSPLSDRLMIAASEDQVRPAPEPENVAAEAAAPEPAPEPEPQRSVWDRVADCESGSWTGDGGFVDGSANWSATAGLFEGGLQFHPDTWDGFKDPGMPGAAYEASRAQQIAVAERVLDAQGWRAWPVCSRKLGLR